MAADHHEHEHIRRDFDPKEEEGGSSILKNDGPLLAEAKDFHFLSFRGDTKTFTFRGAAKCPSQISHPFSLLLISNFLAYVAQRCAS